MRQFREDTRRFVSALSLSFLGAIGIGILDRNNVLFFNALLIHVMSSYGLIHQLKMKPGLETDFRILKGECNAYTTFHYSVLNEDARGS